MLAQILIELSRVARWKAEAFPAQTGVSSYAQEAYHSFRQSADVNDTCDGMCTCFMAGFEAGVGMLPTNRGRFLARYAVGAIVAMLQVSDDPSQVGADIMDETQEQVRRMVDAKVRAERERARQSGHWDDGCPVVYGPVIK